MTATTTPSTSQAPATIRLARTRVVILTCCYALLSLWALLLSLPGIGALVTGQLPDPSFRFAAVGATCFKILTVGPALAVALTRGRSTVAVRALIGGQVVWFVADLLAPQADDGPLVSVVRFLVGLLIWVGPWLALATDRRRVWRRARQARPLVVSVAAAAVIPAVVWAIGASSVAISAQLGVDEALELRFDLCGLPLVLLAAALLAGTHRSLWWDVVVGSTSIVVALAALLLPAGPGSPGPAGAAACLLTVSLILDHHRERDQQRRGRQALRAAS